MTDRLRAWLDQAQHLTSGEGAVALAALRAVVEVATDENLRPFYPAGWDACASAVLRAIEKEVLR